RTYPLKYFIVTPVWELMLLWRKSLCGNGARAHVQLERDCDLVSRLQRTEHEHRWLDSEIGHQNRLRPRCCGIALGTTVRLDEHLDGLLLAGDRQRSHSLKRYRIVCRRACDLVSGELVADLRIFVGLESLEHVLLETAVSARQAFHRDDDIDGLQ